MCSSYEDAADKAITAQAEADEVAYEGVISQLIEGELMSERELPACRARLARKMARNRGS